MNVALSSDNELSDLAVGCLVVSAGQRIIVASENAISFSKYSHHRDDFRGTYKSNLATTNSE